MAKSYKVQVRRTDSSQMVEASAARFRTYQAARNYALDLYMRRPDMDAWLVVETEDEVYP